MVALTAAFQRLMNLKTMSLKGKTILQLADHFFRENEINYKVDPCKKRSSTYYFERVLRVIKSCGKSGLVATTAHMANLKLSSVGSGL